MPQLHLEAFFTSLMEPLGCNKKGQLTVWWFRQGLGRGVCPTDHATDARRSGHARHSPTRFLPTAPHLNAARLPRVRRAKGAAR